MYKLSHYWNWYYGQLVVVKTTGIATRTVTAAGVVLPIGHRLFLDELDAVSHCLAMVRVSRMTIRTRWCDIYGRSGSLRGLGQSRQHD